MFFRFRLPRKTLVQQRIQLRSDYPDSSVRIIRNTLFWEGVVCPTPLSRKYNLHIEYKLTFFPIVWISMCELQNHAMIPHKFSIDYRRKRIPLCLFYPGYCEWTEKMPISRTLVLWAIEWLYYYEIWLTTGKWLGGGIHPESDPKRLRRKIRSPNPGV